MIRGLDSNSFFFVNSFVFRINYVRFLKHHAPVPELVGLVDQTNSKPLSTVHEKSPRSTTDRSILSQVSNKLRRKVR